MKIAQTASSVANLNKKQPSTATAIQVQEASLLSGPKLILRPAWVHEFDGIGQALLYEYFSYRAAYSLGLRAPLIRVSYTRLQQRLPFYSRRWIIELIQRLSATGAITIVHTGRVNQFAWNDDYQRKTPADGKSNRAMLVFPSLACKVGLLEAMALQQVHLRCYDASGDRWTIQSFEQWHTQVFPFVSMATVKRLFRRLRSEGLVYALRYISEFGAVNSYRVNYLQLSQVMGLPLPERLNKGNQVGWVDPVYPNLTHRFRDYGSNDH